MSHHHPDDTLLLGLAAGMLDSGTAIVVAAHVERCVHCQTRVRDFESVGGAMLEELEPAVLAPEPPAVVGEPGTERGGERGSFREDHLLEHQRRDGLGGGDRDLALPRLDLRDHLRDERLPRRRGLPPCPGQEVERLGCARVPRGLPGLVL